MELPPDAAIAVVVRSYARVLARRPGELAARPMVLPNATFFPDTYTGDLGSLERLVKRMQLHAGLERVAIEPAIAESSGCSCESGGGGCGGGGCGGGGCDDCTCDKEAKKVPRLVRTEAGFRISVLDPELDTPEILAVQIARSLGAAWILGKEHDMVPAGLGDLAAVGLGFGALLLEGSYVYRKGCHGASVARFTELGCAELAIAFSLFVAMGRHPERRARGALGTTQRALFNDAMVWAKSNLAIVESLHKSPARVAAGEFRLMEPRPWLSRLFGSGRPAKDVSLPGPDASIDEIEAALAGVKTAERPAKKPDPELDEIKKLVDEAFGEAGQAG